MADKDKEDVQASKTDAPDEQEEEESESEEEEGTIYTEGNEEALVPSEEEADDHPIGEEETTTTAEAASAVTEEALTEEGVYSEQTREPSAITADEGTVTQDETVKSRSEVAYTMSPVDEDISAATLISMRLSGMRAKETAETETTMYPTEMEPPASKIPDTRFISIYETIIDDLGNEVTIEQKAPILEETTEYERVSIKNVQLSEYEDIQATSADSLFHFYVQRTNFVIEKTTKTEDGDPVMVEENIFRETKTRRKPPPNQSIFRKTIDDEGNEIRQAITGEKLDDKKKRRSIGGTLYSSGSSEEEVELEGEKLKKRNLRLEESRLNDRLKTVLIKIALEKKKQKKLIKLISLSINLAENPGKKRDAKKKDKNDEEWVYQSKGLDDWKPLYLEQLMEHKKLRANFLAKVEVERKKMDEALAKARVLDVELNEVRNAFIGKLKITLSKLKPNSSELFQIQSPEQLVEQIIKLELELMNERKIILKKQSKVDLMRKEIEEKKRASNLLCQRFDLCTKEIDNLNGKNDRRNKKLEVLKKTIRDNCLSLAHTDQKLVSARRNVENQNEKMFIVQDYLLQNRLKRQEVHKKRMRIEKYIDKTMNNEEAADYLLLQKEYENLQTQMNSKKALLLQMKHDLKEQQSYFSTSKSVWKQSRVDFK